MQFITYLIIGLSFVNVLRLALYMIAGDIYSITTARKRAMYTRSHTPSVTLIVPAYNEETVIAETITSLAQIDYPKSKLQVIVVNDGSKDSTAKIARECIRSLPKDSPIIRLINRPNRGKAGAINHILRYYVKSTLVVCLDADSQLSKDAIRNIAQYFRDRNVIACSSNVNIIEDGTLFTLIQKFEYLVGYQAKRGLSLLNTEYIVGGVGSAFRMSALRTAGFYDTNTLTEDIDLTMKLILAKHKNQRIVYAQDSHAYTQAVHSFKEFSGQRFRWKYGRLQTFLKHKSLFFSKQANHSKRVSWFMLPYVLMLDVIFFFEPLIVAWLIFVMVMSFDITMLNSAIVLLTGYTLMSLWSSSAISTKDKLRLSYYAPTMYVFIYVLSLAEYIALLKSLLRLPHLPASIKSKHITWTSPARRGIAN